MAVRRASAESLRTTQDHTAQASIASLLNLELPDWHKGAICAQTSPDDFFPDKGGSTKPAKSVCWGRTTSGMRPTPECPVRAQCLQWALSNEVRYGVWGGFSERERRKLQRRQLVLGVPA